MALLVVIYTIADARYKFRIAVTPGALYVATFVVLAIVGLQTLLTEIWIVEGWWVPKTQGITRATWQGVFGLLFLGTFLTWMYYAFIRPPIFGRRNARRFARELYRYILRGNDDELKIIANELARSAKSLIAYARRLPPRFAEDAGARKGVKRSAEVEDYAHDILLLIANRKLCRQIVATSPVTAQALFEEMTNIGKFDIPIGQFARNISSEAIAQKGSFLYDEAEGYSSGLLGYLKPVSHAVYGNFALVETLASNVASPLDIHFEEQWAWDAKQWEAYCRATLITLTNCLERGCGSPNSYALNRAMHGIESAYRDLHRLNDSPDAYGTDIYDRLRVAADFVKSAIDLIDKQTNPPPPLCRVREGTYPKNIYDHLALLIFDLCFAASTVKSPPDLCWTIHHNIVWSTIFSRIGSDGAAWKIVRLKVRRLLYDEIAKLTEFPNFKGSRILGFCLNVLGMNTGRNKQNYGTDAYALAKAIHSWTRKHYLSIRQENPDVARSVLIGSLSFDEASNRLVKTYFKGLNREAPRTYLELDLPGRLPPE
ncbi:MAG: hypothetical protein HY017_04750 [Betaproteobacteria bacterium]|nr:hypothetical protein [Betaproteobacteria bacterium]